MSTNTKTLLTVKTDKNLKKAAEKTAEKIGLPLGTLVNALLRQFVRNKGVFLTTEEYYVPNKKTARSLRKADKDREKGLWSEPVTLDELASELHS